MLMWKKVNYVNPLANLTQNEVRFEKLVNLSSTCFYADFFVLVFFFNFANDHGCDFQPAKNVLVATKMLYTY